ncbi:MAG: FtsX-like permease family protein [Acidobacteriota bacterium]|nr:FtsX-like permease family protein [Acidobacteriota bacterium]
MTFRFVARQILREFRGAGSRLLYFTLCLTLGVGAVVLVAGLSLALDQSIRREARSLLAADLAVLGSRPTPPEVVAAAEQLPGSRTSRVVETVTIVAAGGGAEPAERPPRTLLVELKIVDGPYPFYGALRLEPDARLDDLLGSDGVVVAPDLLPRLGTQVGDTLRLGGEPFTIRGVVLEEPDRIGAALTLGPRVFASRAGLARTPLQGFGSRIDTKLLIALPEGTTPAQLRGAKAELEAYLPPEERFRVETYDQAQPAIRRGLDRLERYLGLVALLSLLVGGIGVGQAVRSWVSSRLDAIAVLKCLGVRPREALALYFGQALLLGLIGSLAGAVLGTALLYLTPALLADLIPSPTLVGTGRFQVWQPAAIVRGLLLGVGVTAIFGLLPLSRVLQVPPSRVLRRDAEPLAGSRTLVAGCGVLLILGIGALAAAQSGSPRLAAQFTGGLLATTIALATAAWGLTRIAQRVPRGTGRLWLRHGLASLGRPGAATVGAIVAVGLGLLVVFATRQVQTQLLEQMAEELPKDAPSMFLVDVQTDQWDPLASLLKEQGASDTRSVPVVMARLRAIDGVKVAELVETSARRSRRWALTREQRLTYMQTLPEDNRIVEGALWADPSPYEISLEEEFAREDLGVGVGAMLEFDLQGIPIEFKVTSLRAVDWESFGINFFLVAEPGSLEEAPQFRLATTQIPKGMEQATQDIVVSRFPNITVVMLRDLLDRVISLLSLLGIAISLLGAFTLVAGFAILTATVGVESRRRGREVALMKTLGMKRNGIAALFATEYALMGLVAGIIGAAGGGVVSWIALTEGMELEWSFRPLEYLQAIAICTLLTVVAGVAASIGPMRRRPVEVLRELESA